MAFPVDEKYILETEQKMGIKFPAVYRQNLMENNGSEFKTGEGTWSLHPVLDTSSAEQEKRTSDHVHHQTEIARLWEEFPRDGIVIASSQEDNKLVFLKEYYDSEKVKNGVFFWHKAIGYIKIFARDFSEILSMGKLAG